MDVKLKTLDDLFNQPIRYVVPDYQRKYVWELHEQWEPLWEDVQGLAEQLLDQRGSEEHETEQVRPHFMGSIVLNPPADAPTQPPTLEIVDGQQRLMTLQLMLDAAQQELIERQPEAARQLAELVLNPLVGRFDDRDYEFKMWPADDEDRTAFRQAMRNELPTDAYEKERIVEAHSWFADRVGKWLDEQPKAQEQRASALHDALTRHVQISAIELDENDDEQVIFETLNSRGTALGTFDLAKNFLLREARRQGIDRERLQRDHLNRLNLKWWQQETGSGRQRREHIEAFLHHWLTMETTREVPLGQTFALFRKHVSEAREGKIERVVADIADFAEFYREIQTADKAGRFGGEFVRRWKVLQIDAFSPLVLWLWRHGGTDAQVERAYAALESYMVRRLICSLDTRGYSAMALELLGHVKRRGRTGPDKIIAEHLASQKSDRERWPTDTDVITDLVGGKLLGPASVPRTRMILEAVELSFRGSQWRASGGAELAKRPLSVEHIMPRHWQSTDWARPKAVPASSSETAEQARNRMIHSIGNLTLVNRRYNSRLSDGTWTRKRGLYREDPEGLALTADLINPGGKAPPRVWDEEQIRKRSERLAKRVIRVWPRPS